MTDLHKTPGLFGKQYLPRDVAELLYDTGWTDAYVNVRMNSTVQAESGRYAAAVGTVNPDGSQDWGMFQLNNRHWQSFGYKDQESFYQDAIIPEKAAPMARKLFLADRAAGGTGFGPWAAYGNDNWKQALPSSCGGLANAIGLDLFGKTVC